MSLLKITLVALRYLLTFLIGCFVGNCLVYKIVPTKTQTHFDRIIVAEFADLQDAEFLLSKITQQYLEGTIKKINKRYYVEVLCSNQSEINYTREKIQQLGIHEVTIYQG